MQWNWTKVWRRRRPWSRWRSGLARATFLHTFITDRTIGEEIIAAIFTDIAALGYVTFVMNGRAVFLDAAVTGCAYQIRMDENECHA